MTQQKLLVAIRCGASLTLLTLWLAGCAVGAGGQPSPTQYNCGTLPDGCNQRVGLHVPRGELTGIPWVVSTSLLVAPIACDTACRGSSGYFIANYMQVADNVHGYFIRAGYGTDANGVPSFFYEMHLPGSTFQHVEIFPTSIDAGNPTPAFMGLQIYALEGESSCPTREWLLDLSFSAAYPQPSGGEYYPEHYRPAVGCSEFQPDTWVFGQRLVGTSGATAKLAVFTNNRYATTAVRTADCGGTWCIPDPTKGTFLTHDGVVTNNMPPPYVGWTTPPSTSKEGGFFYTECCQPLP